MGYRYEESCNDCPDCHGCGRRFKRYKQLFCDKCEADVDELFISLDQGELCWDCFIEQYTSKHFDDEDGTLCAHCGSDDEKLFQVEGEWICEECLKSMVEKVED